MNSGTPFLIERENKDMMMIDTSVQAVLSIGLQLCKKGFKILFFVLIGSACLHIVHLQIWA